MRREGQKEGRDVEEKELGNISDGMPKDRFRTRSSLRSNKEYVPDLYSLPNCVKDEIL